MKETFILLFHAVGDVVLVKVEFGVWWPTYIIAVDDRRRYICKFWNENTV